MSDIKKNLEIILNIKDIEKRIRSLEDKSNIPGTTGIGNQSSPPGNSTSSGSGGTGTGGANGANTGTGDSSSNPEGDTVKPGEEAFDKLKVGDRLDQLTDIYNCNTGEELNLSPNGRYSLPEGWEDPETPPQRPGWELGSYWVGTGVYFGTTNKSTVYEFESLAIGYYSVPFGYTVTNTRNTVYTSNPSGNIIGASQEVFIDWSATAFPENTGWAPTSYLLNQQLCGVDLGVTPECPIVAPTVPWPSGEPTQLAWQNGKWRSNPNQPDVPAEYEGSSRSTIEFCFGDSLERKGRFEPAADGGTIMYELDEEGNPLDDGLHFDENGVLNYMISKTQIDRYKA